MDSPLHPKRPEVACSTVALKSKYTVQHRSDLLMKEHIQNVCSFQDALKVAIARVESAKTRTELERWTQTASELKEKADSSVLILQVMKKLDTELDFARSDLNDALYKGQGDINAARKRVIWLEDKMGELCGKKRLKSRPVNRLNRNYDSGSDSQDEQSLDSRKHFDKGERERTHSLAQILGSNIGLTSTDTETSRSGGQQPNSSDSQRHRYGASRQVEVPGKPLHLPFQHHRSLHWYHSPVEASPRQKNLEEREMFPEHHHLYTSMSTFTSVGQEDMAEKPSGEFSTLKKMLVLGTKSQQGTSEMMEDDRQQSLQSVQQQEHLIPVPKSASERSDDASNCLELEEEAGGSPSIPSHTGYDYCVEDQTPKPPYSRAHKDPEDEEDEEKEEEEEGVEGEDGDGVEKRMFITEYGVMDYKRKVPLGKQQVTIESPRKEAQEEFVEEAGEDLGSTYWQSEHHRFEYSSFSGLFGEVDPLSYHTMGLAVPGSFLQKSETDFTELPWKTVLTAKDIKDIHREALDKLALKVHGMQDKIYNAAMLSVQCRPPAVEGIPEASFLQSLDMKASDLTASQPSMQRKSKSLLSLNMEDKGSLEHVPAAPKVERQTTNTSTSSRLTFYPKPIPPPHVLPITRTNQSMEFPRFASSFAEPDPNQRRPAERIVDQRNLMQETKLVLYRQKHKPDTPGPSSMEQRFRRMIEHDSSQSQKFSGKKVQSKFKMVAGLSSMQSAVGTWQQIKPRSRSKEYQGLRWERVKTIVHKNLSSDKVEERIDAAKQLGLLRCGDTMVFYALKERLHRDSNQRVRYEATKALILNGCWEDEVLRMVLKYLVMGNTEVRSDLISTLIQGKNVMYVDKSIPTFFELVKVLSHFCHNPDPEDQIAFDSAVLLGRLCVRDASAEVRLIQSLKDSTDTHIKAKALEILVKQLTRIDGMIMDQILALLEQSPVWKYRVLATKLLISLGPRQKYVLEKQDDMYGLLTRRLWDDPSSEVRLSAAKALTALGLFGRACQAVENHLEDPDEKVRAEAVISVGTLGMKNERVIRLLLEMLELDSSEYVRLMIIRTFCTLKLADRRVMRTLHEREKLEGPLARESKRALQVLESAMLNLTPRSLSSRALTTPKAVSALSHSRHIFQRQGWTPAVCSLLKCPSQVFSLPLLRPKLGCHSKATVLCLYAK